MTAKAKVLSDKDIQQVLAAVHFNYYESRNRCIFMCSLLAGLRACEIAPLTVKDVKELDRIVLSPAMTKGPTNRVVLLSERLQAEIRMYLATLDRTEGPLFSSNKGRVAFTSHGIVMLLKRLYEEAGIVGASSHSGRRTFITKLAAANTPIRVLQELAGHKYIGTTQGYIDVNDDMLRKAVELM